MRMFEVVVSEATARLMRKAFSSVKVSDERFSTTELIQIRKFIVEIDNAILGEDDECNS